MGLYTVWVGGGEVNDHYLRSRQSAESIASQWIEEGYDDVTIVEVA